MLKFKAVCWMFLGSFFGSLNDVFTKILSSKFDPIEIASARFLFAIICLLPFIANKPKILKTEKLSIHFIRGLIFFYGNNPLGNGFKVSTGFSSCVNKLQWTFFFNAHVAIFFK